MTKKINLLICVFLCLVLFLFTTRALITGFNHYSPVQILDQTPFIRTSLTSSPIAINSKVELANTASSGNGSSWNPYIIANYTIDCDYSGHTGVSVQNTDKYFILQDITVLNCRYGFNFMNVTFGSIINSFATNNTNSGFLFENSNNAVLTNKQEKKKTNGDFY